MPQSVISQTTPCTALQSPKVTPTQSACTVVTERVSPGLNSRPLRSKECEPQ